MNWNESTKPGGGGADVCKKTKDVSDVKEQMNYLYSSITDLTKIIDILREKLATVLDDRPTVCSEKEENKEDYIVPLARDIREATKQVERNKTNLFNIIDRIEL